MYEETAEAGGRPQSESPDTEEPEGEEPTLKAPDRGFNGSAKY